jgi:glycogen synthase
VAHRRRASVKIAMIVPEYPPDVIGGGGVVFEALAKEYAARGHTVKVYSSWDPARSWTAAPTHEREGSVALTRCPLVPLGSKWPSLRSVPPPNLRACQDIWRDLSLWRPDVAHMHGYGHAIVDVAAWFLRARRVPFVFTIHGLPITPSQRSRPVRLAYGAYERLGPRRVMRRACAVTAVSSPVARAVQDFARVDVISNGVSPLPRGSPRGGRELRRELGIAPGLPVIAAAGRLTRSKGFDVLIESFGRLDVPRAACVIAGLDAGELATLSALGASLRPGLVVRLTGPLDRARLGELVEAATVVAVPSRDEPFGLVALEALAAERRVVASRIGSLPEFLNGPVAELVEAEDRDALAAALARGLERGPLSRAEREVARTMVAAHSWMNVAGRYEALLLACAARHSCAERAGG